jgi:hypothetical protein
VRGGGWKVGKLGGWKVGGRFMLPEGFIAFRFLFAGKTAIFVNHPTS